MFADGYGDWGERALHASAVMPVSSISKTITAVAVLQLVQAGDLDLRAKVFGSGGVLSNLKPLSGIPKDPRVHDITVEHLLRHSAGWDEEKGPVFDPMLNKLYLERGHDVVDIAKAMNSGSYLSQYDVIRFMLNTPLDYEPGLRSKKSNFGYSVLGRVIEEVTDLPYEEYVKKHILNPCGMLHTRIGPRFSDEYLLGTQGTPGAFATAEMSSRLVQGLIDPEMLDSTLGWYSNVYDLGRFMSCLLGHAPRRLLTTQTLSLMFKRPTEPPSWYEDSWRGIGFHVRKDGAFWVDSDVHDNDVIIYHQGAWQDPDWSNPTEKTRDGTTAIILTTNDRFKKLKSVSERIVEMVDSWPEDMEDVSIEQELADLEIDDTIVRYQLGETYLQGYVNALRMSRYKPTWIHGYTDGDYTEFAIIAQKAKTSDDADFELLIEASKTKLFSHVAQLQSRGYYLSFLQSYESFSHDDRITHIALLTQTSRPLPAERWGVAENTDQYFNDLRADTTKGYTLEAQSIVALNAGSRVTYLMRQLDPETNERDFMSYHSMTLKELEDETRTNAERDYVLAYLDTYLIDDEPRFSAIYRHHVTQGRWVLQTSVTLGGFQDEAEHWEDLGYVPKLVVGYEDPKGLRFATFWQKP